MWQPVALLLLDLTCITVPSIANTCIICSSLMSLIIILLDHIWPYSCCIWCSWRYTHAWPYSCCIWCSWRYTHAWPCLTLQLLYLVFLTLYSCMTLSDLTVAVSGVPDVILMHDLVWPYSCCIWCSWRYTHAWPCLTLQLLYLVFLTLYSCMTLFDLTVAVSGVPDVILMHDLVWPWQLLYLVFLTLYSCMTLFDLTVAVSGDPDVILMHDLVWPYSCCIWCSWRYTHAWPCLTLQLLYLVILTLYSCMTLFDLTVAVSGVPDVILMHDLVWPYSCCIWCSWRYTHAWPCLTLQLLYLVFLTLYSCMTLFDLTVAVSGDPDVILMHDLVWPYSCCIWCSWRYTHAWPCLTLQLLYLVILTLYSCMTLFDLTVAVSGVADVILMHDLVWPYSCCIWCSWRYTHAWSCLTLQLLYLVFLTLYSCMILFDLTVAVSGVPDVILMHDLVWPYSCCIWCSWRYTHAWPCLTLQLLYLVFLTLYSCMTLFDLTVAVSGVPDVILMHDLVWPYSCCIWCSWRYTHAWPCLTLQLLYLVFLTLYSCMTLFDLTVAVSGDPDVILMHDLVWPYSCCIWCSWRYTHAWPCLTLQLLYLVFLTLYSCMT